MRWFSWFRRHAARTAPSIQAGKRDYMLGDSDAEISRLDMQHYMFRREFGNDFLAPVTTPSAVLDVACGTGRWARDTARRFPGAAIIGFDINQEQIDRALAAGSAGSGDTLPENCTFVVGDALQRFAFPNQSFDLVMARATSAFVPIARYPAMIAEMTRVARPGGWVELRDFGLARSQSQALTMLTEIFAKMTAARGSHPGSGPFLLTYVQGTGLRDIQVRTVTVRSGSTSATRGGRLMLTDYLALLERIAPLMARSGIIVPAQWERLLAQARQETLTLATEVDLTAVWGRR